MTQTQINAVFANITTGGANTAVEALACWDALKDEIYVDQTLQNGTTATIIERQNAGINHTLNFAKRGNKVIVSGYFDFTTGFGLPTNTLMFDFIASSPFKPKSGIEQYLNCVALGSNVNFPLVLNSTNDGEIRNTNPIYPNSMVWRYVVTGEYLTNK